MQGSSEPVTVSTWMTSFVTRFHDEHIVDHIDSELKKDILNALLHLNSL
jgi:hypothetical protein